MICRLCLIELLDFVPIFNVDSKALDINNVADLIQKHCQIELKLNDPVSTKICHSCWQQLHDFNHFYQMVSEKQQTLLLKCEEPTDHEMGVEAWLAPEVHIMEMPKRNPAETEDRKDVKDAILDEPEIEANLNEHSGVYNSSDDDEIGKQHAVNALDDCETTKKKAPAKRSTRLKRANKRRQPKKATMQTNRKKSKAAATTADKLPKVGQQQCVRTSSRLAMAAVAIQKVEKTEIISKPSTPTSPASQEKNEMTALKSPDATPLPTPVSSRSASPTSAARSRSVLSTISSSSSAASSQFSASPEPKHKRGRPKGSKSKGKSGKPPPPTAESIAQQEERRNHVLEMDKFIAANVKLECCLCAHPLRDFPDLKQHFRMQHNCNGYVRCCNNRFNKRALYVDHLNLHKNPEYFRCKACGKNYVNRNSYEMHLLRFHTDAQSLKHECKICGKRFARTYLLTMHKKNHKGTERKEVCNICNKAFRTPHELRAHEKRMHDEAFEPVICDVCGAHFRNETNFVIHKKTVHREGPPEPELQCHLCGHWLRDRRCLRRHMARHSDASITFKCTQCDEVKATRAALSGHMRYHHSGKQHQCSLCGKEFKIARNLKEHMATHTGIDLYACPFCTRTFKSYANMHNHKKKMHSGDWVRKYTVPSTVSAAAPVASEATDTLSLATTTDSC